MTELTGVVLKVHYPDHDNNSSVGALILNTEAMLLDDEGVEITAYNQPGGLFIRGPTVFKGYYKNRVATDECLESGFIWTGDVVYIEPESKKLFILDRKKDRSNLGAANVAGMKKALNSSILEAKRFIIFLSASILSGAFGDVLSGSFLLRKYPYKADF
ncbi:uncharacterized protein FPRN_11847 [Fusarium proliferatum]|nr:uncharacterized protein FPRN_11847 [Fusarium proliferatum]